MSGDISAGSSANGSSDWGSFGGVSDAEGSAHAELRLTDPSGGEVPVGRGGEGEGCEYGAARVEGGALGDEPAAIRPDLPLVAELGVRAALASVRERAANQVRALLGEEILQAAERRIARLAQPAREAPPPVCLDPDAVRRFLL